MFTAVQKYLRRLVSLNVVLASSLRDLFFFELSHFVWEFVERKKCDEYNSH